MIAISIQAAVAELGLNITKEQEKQFTIYRDMLLAYNEHVNLTAITNPDGVVRKHFVDSLSAMKAVPIEGSCIDIGTGAGFPGLPLAIVYPNLRVVLLDSLDKRVRFLRDVVNALGLGGRVEAIHGRAEDIARLNSHREQYDIAISRAVARLNVLAEFCLPFVKIGGNFVAMKGPAAEQEIEEAKNALQLLGGGKVRSTHWVLPGDLPEERLLVTVEKIKPTPSIYPRRAGTPAKKPLA